MSDQPGPDTRARTALRTRVLMAGVFVGALVAMTMSWVFSWGPESERVKAEREAERIVAAREAAFRSPPGSCLTWTAPDAGDVHKVSCEQEHLFEVVGVADLADKYPPRAPLPDLDTWRELTEERCGALVEDYLPKPLDPEGKLTIGVLRPDGKQWAQGERMLHCGLQWVGPGGGLQKLTQPVKEMNQSNVWEPGTCLALTGKTVGDPIPCSEEHSYEIIGLVDLSDEFDEFPPEDKQETWLDTTCSKVAEKYTGGKDLKKEGLILGWDLRSAESWKAGSTLVNCKVGAVLKDRSGLAPVRGSVRKAAEPKKSEADKPKSGKPEPDKPKESGKPDQDEPAEPDEPTESNAAGPGQSAEPGTDDGG